jgi:cytochrome c biogenesis protein CcmG/thiol:disulfide interchange protein DsbE
VTPRRTLGLKPTFGLLLALSLLAGACSSDRAPARADGAGTRLLPEDRLALPEFDLAKYQALLEELRGTRVLVNFWASWCAPCRIEAPGLARLASEFEGQVQFLGVNILDARRPAREFILEFDWQYPSVLDPLGKIRDGLGYIGQPITVIYDREGTKTFEWAGIVSEDQLRREIRKVI